MSRSARAVATGVLCLGLVGCALALGGNRAPTTYDLVAPRSFASASKSARFQLVVSEPSAVHALETDRIMVRQGEDRISYYKGIAWSDRLPRLVQARMIETFQNSGAVKAVNASGDYSLATELRAFQIDVSGTQTAADVDVFAKLINGSGKVVASKDFTARATASSDSPAHAVAALNQAFTEVVQDTTTWVGSRR
jgi:cholesterol transport system auxiliary component